jgi:short-subunit dehydrogenase
MTTVQGTALITGASAGIGATYAEKLAKRGHDLVLVARDAARMETLAGRLRAEHGVTIEVLRADLTVDADIAAVEARLASGEVSILVNNAGMAMTGGILDNGPVELTRLISLNVIAPTRLASAAGKAFVAKGAGVIVNIASVLALAPEMFDAVYSGTKAFVLNLSQGMAAQLADKGVHVQAVLPGATRTEIWERSGTDIEAFPPEMVMDVDDLVDAALVGLDKGETVTIPPLADEGQWEAMQAARRAMAPGLSRREVAARYRETAQA